MSNALKCLSYEFNPEKTENYCGVFVSEKELEQEAGLGKLIILVRIDSREKKTKETIKKIKEEFLNHFYLASADDPEQVMETSCQFFNEHLAELIDKPLKSWNKISMLVAVIKEEKIFLSQAGPGVGAWLLRNNKFFNILGEEHKKGKSEKNDKKLFDQLITGKLETDDSLLFASTTIYNYFSQNKIKEMMSGTPGQGIGYFRRLIENSIKKDSFAIILTKYLKLETRQNEKKNEIMNTFKNQDSSNYSMDELVSLEKNTSTLLKSSPVGILRKLSAYGHAITKFINKFKKERKSDFNQLAPKKFLISHKVGVFIRQLFKKEGKNNKEQSVTRPVADPNSDSTTFLKPADLSGVKKKFLSIKFLFSFSLALICLFIVSLVILSYQQKRTAQENEIKNILDDINGNIDTAESALIYQDKTKSRENILKAQNQLNDSADLLKEKNDIASLNKLINRINDVMIESFNVAVLENLEPFADLSAYLPAEENMKINDIVVLDQIYLTAGQKILRINPKTKEIKSSEHDKGELLGGATFDDQTIVYLSKLGQFFQYNKTDNSLSGLKIDMTKEKTVAVYQIYSKKMYIADREKKQIYKHDFLGGGFIAGKDWLKDDTDISKILDLTIDGNIYLLKTDGVIDKMLSGRKQDFAIKDLDKPIVNATKIYTNPNLPDLYLLDSANNRLILIDKNKQIMTKQFYSASLAQVNDFAVADNGKTIYLSSDNKIYKINN